MKLMKKLYKGI